MERTAKELLKDYVNSQSFTSTNEIMSAMKEIFGDVLQQVMESEFEVEFGYEKSQKSTRTADEMFAKNYRNRFSKKQASGKQSK